MSSYVVPEDALPADGRSVHRHSRLNAVALCIVIVEVVVALIAGIILAVHGGGGGDPAFDCDIAAVGLLGSSVFMVLVSFLFDLVVPAPAPAAPLDGRGPAPKTFFGNVKSRLWLVLHVITMGLVTLVLIAHATVFLIQCLLIVASICWVVCTSSVFALLYRWGNHQQLPYAVEVLLKMPRLVLMVVWVFCASSAHLLLYFRSLSDLQLPQDLGRLEIYILCSIGGLMISALFWVFVMVILSRNFRAHRRLLLLPSEPHGTSLGFFVTLLRAILLSFCAHVLAGGFPFILAYGAMTSIIIGMARLSLRGVRPKRDAASNREDDIVGDEEQATPLKLASRRSHKEPSTFSIVKRTMTIVFMLLFGFGKVTLLFCIFLFDLAFVERHLSGSATKNFVFARANASCGISEEVVSNDAWDALDCATMAAAKGSAFSFGVGANGNTCIAHTLPDGFSHMDYLELRQEPAVWDCLNSSVGEWNAKAGFDFYVLEPTKSCSMLYDRRLLPADGFHERRLTADNASSGNATNSTDNEASVGQEMYLDAAPLHLYGAGLQFPEAAGKIFGGRVRSSMRWVLHHLRGIMHVRIKVPEQMPLQCAGIRRLGSAFALFGAVVSVAAIAALDVLGVMSASTAIAKVRAVEAGGFAGYIMTMARAHALEQSALLILQLAISSGIALELEAVGVFAQHCGVLVGEEHLIGTECSVFWHVPVDGAAAMLIFCSLFLAVAIIYCTFGGHFYGLETARWAIVALFGDDLRLSRFGSGMTSRTMAVERGDGKFFLRPFVGVPVTFGIWTRGSSKSFQIGARQDWYEPIPFDVMAEEQDPSTGLVTWKSMYNATSRSISLAWVPIPYIGGVLAKGAQYLNEHVIFAFGKDGGATPAEDDHIRTFFQEDTPLIVHVLHWIACAVQFFVIVMIQLDFVGLREQRVQLLSICIIVVLVFAGFRVCMDLIRELIYFVNSRGLGSCAMDVIEEGMPALVLQHSKEGGVFDDGDDPLAGICGEHRKQIVRSCQELLELTWVEERRFGREQRGLLNTSRGRRSRWKSSATSLLKALAKEEKHVTEGMARGAVLLLLREAAENEICHNRARRAAKKAAKEGVYRTASERAQRFQLYAEERARNEVAKEAARRMQEFEDDKRRYFDQQRGPDRIVERIPKPVEPPRWLRTTFTSRLSISVKVVGQWTHTKLELTKEHEASADVLVIGEVEVECSPGKRASELKASNVTLLPGSRHQIVTHQGTLEEADFVEETSEAAKDEQEEGGSEVCKPSDCNFAWWEQKRSRTCCRCCRSSVAKGQADTTEEKWELRPPLFSASVQAWSLEASEREDDDRHGESALTASAVQKLEAAVRESVYSPNAMSIVGVFLATLSVDCLSLSAEDASRRARLMAVTSRMLRRREKRMADTMTLKDRECSSIADSDSSGNEAQSLQAALACDPPDVDILTKALAKARKADVDPAMLSEAEELHTRLMDRQKQALQLVEAIESRMIKKLAEAIANAEEAGIKPEEFPDEDGVGVMSKAQSVLLEERRNAKDMLESSVESGRVLQLQRAIAQAREAEIDDEALISRAEEQLQSMGRRKSGIWLLKMAMRSNNVGLLKSAVDECEGPNETGAERSDSNIEVGHAKKLLQNLESASSKLHEAAEKKVQRTKHESVVRQVRIEAKERGKSAMDAALAVKQMRAKAAVRAAVFAEPPDPGMLRLALQQANASGHTGPDVDRAQQLLVQEADKEAALDQVRLSTAMHDVTELSRAITRCHELGVDPKRLLTALSQLIENHAKIVRKAGGHGLSNAVLIDIERERRDLHEEIQQTYGGLRTICRIRPWTLDELAAFEGQAKPKPAVARVDRQRISLDGSRYHFNIVFNSDCIQAEVFNEIRSVVQSAVDGHNVLVMACGPAGAGKTHTMQGGSHSESRGLIPRMVNELFEIFYRDEWRTSFDVDVQMVEVRDERHMVDLFASRKMEQSEDEEFSDTPGEIVDGAEEIFNAPTIQPTLSVRMVPLASFGASTPSESCSRTASKTDGISSFVVIDGAATRRVGTRLELRNMVDGGYHTSEALVDSPLCSILIVIYLTKTNRETGVTSRSKLVFIDFVACGESASNEANGVYDALESLFRARAEHRKLPFGDHALTQLMEDCLRPPGKAVLLLALPPGRAGGNNADTLRAVKLAEICKMS